MYDYIFPLGGVVLLLHKGRSEACRLSLNSKFKHRQKHCYWSYITRATIKTDSITQTKGNDICRGWIYV